MCIFLIKFIFINFLCYSYAIEMPVKKILSYTKSYIVVWFLIKNLKELFRKYIINISRILLLIKFIIILLMWGRQSACARFFQTFAFSTWSIRGGTKTWCIMSGFILFSLVPCTLNSVVCYDHTCDFMTLQFVLYSWKFREVKHK